LQEQRTEINRRNRHEQLRFQNRRRVLP
jgi:hypothetical protein